MRSFFKRQEGTGVVEFALVAGILFMLLFGIWDFGRLFDAWLVTTNAAREGARYGAVYGGQLSYSDSDVINTAKQKAFDYLQSGFGTRTDVTSYTTGNVNVQFPSGRAIGEPVEVTVSLQVEVWPLISDLFFQGSKTANISGSAVMRM